MSNRTIGSRAIAHAFGYKPDAMRAWRYVGNLDGIGKMRSGVMLYDMDDVALLATAVHLVDVGWRIEMAFAVVRRLSAPIRAALDPTHTGQVVIKPNEADSACRVTIEVRELIKRAIAKVDDFEQRHAS